MILKRYNEGIREFVGTKDEWSIILASIMKGLGQQREATRKKRCVSIDV